MARPTDYGTEERIAEIYAGVWGALPDKEGLDFWVNRVENTEWEFKDVAQSFFDQDRVKAKYSENGTLLEGDDLLAALYENIFRVEEPDAEGFAFWQAQVEADPTLLTTNIGTLIMQMIDGMWANEDAADVQELFKNLVTATELFIEAQEGGTPFSQLSAAEQDAFIAAAAAITADVTAESTQEELFLLVEGAEWPGKPAPPEGETFRLENGVDDITGTAGNDTFNARLDEDGDRTLTAGDLLDGAGGTNRIDVNNDDGAQITGFEANNIQNWFVRALANDTDIDMSGVSGAEQLWNDRSVSGETVTFTDVQNEVILGLHDVRNGTTTLDYETDPTVTSQTIFANGSRDQHSVDLTGSVGVRSLTIDVTADTDLTLLTGFQGIWSLTLTGSADLELEQLLDFVVIRTVDAADLSGDLVLDISGQNSVLNVGRLQSVVLGDGDNTLVVNPSQFDGDRAAANSLRVDLGGGTNTLAVTGANLSGLDFDGANLSIEGAETLAFTNIVSNATLDTGGLEITSLVFEDAVTAGPIEISSFSGDSITFQGNVSGPAVFTANDVEGALSISTEAVANFGVMTLTQATSLSISADVDFTAAGITAAKITSLFIDTNEESLGVVNLGDLTAADLATITVTGEDDVLFDVLAATTELGIIDLSDLAGKATIDLTDSNFAGALTIKVGEGDVDVELNTTAGEARSEVFEFIGNDIGTVDIEGFILGAGINADRLDLTEFGITESTQLEISSSGGGFALIEAGGGEFSGSIELIGVTAAELTPTNFLVTS